MVGLVRLHASGTHGRVNGSKEAEKERQMALTGRTNKAKRPFGVAKRPFGPLRAVSPNPSSWVHFPFVLVHPPLIFLVVFFQILTVFASVTWCSLS